MNRIVIRNILVIGVVMISVASFNVVFANTDRLECIGNQGYVNGTACSQGSAVWGPCNPSRCRDANGDGVDDGKDAEITGCTTYGGSKTCGHWVGCPRCPQTPPCQPSWTGWSACSKECDGGTQSRTNGCGGSQTQACNTEPCIGTCGTGSGTEFNYLSGLNWPAGFDFCDPDSANVVPNPVPFPQLVQNNPIPVTRTWTCEATNGWFGGEPCSVTLNPPSVNCGLANNNTVVDTVPSNNLCSPHSNAVPNPLTLNSNGIWEWTCVHEDFSTITSKLCSAPSCLSGTPIDLQEFVYFDTDGTPNNATVRVTCPDVCCEIDGQDITIGGEQKKEICSGDVGEIEVNPGPQTYTPECWYENEPPVTKTLTTQTMCVARSCNAQGTCQAVPQPALNVSACKSTCNSDADCSTGRMIETRP